MIKLLENPVLQFIENEKVDMNGNITYTAGNYRWLPVKVEADWDDVGKKIDSIKLKEFKFTNAVIKSTHEMEPLYMEFEHCIMEM